MICGLQKMTLLDFPGKVACTVFLGGCNFRCPFCHNSELFNGKPEKLIDDEEFFCFLESRKGLLDGVCVSGGEPTLWKGLPEFVERIKEMGFLVKLDTNGSRPEVIKKLVAKGLVDYIAMDVKNSSEAYAQTVGLGKASVSSMDERVEASSTGEKNDISSKSKGFDILPIEESLRFLIAGEVDYELRTTLVSQLHDEASIISMGQWLKNLVPGKKPSHLYLQTFVDRDTVLFSGLSAPVQEELQKFLDILQFCAEHVSIRNS